MPINLNLTSDEVTFLMHVLGELPSKTGAFTLLMKIKSQVDAQAPKQEDAN